MCRPRLLLRPAPLQPLSSRPCFPCFHASHPALLRHSGNAECVATFAQIHDCTCQFRSTVRTSCVLLTSRVDATREPVRVQDIRPASTLNERTSKSCEKFLSPGCDSAPSHPPAGAGMHSCWGLQRRQCSWRRPAAAARCLLAAHLRAPSLCTLATCSQRGHAVAQPPEHMLLMLGMGNLQLSLGALPCLPL